MPFPIGSGRASAFLGDGIFPFTMMRPVC